MGPTPILEMARLWFLRVIVIRERRNIQNAEFCEVNFGKESRLICLSHIQRRRSFSGRDGARRSTNDFV